VPPIKFGSRSSKLARWQTSFIQRSLETLWPGLKSEQILIQTEGDRVLELPLPEIGGKGLFTQELELALREDRVDVAVHSLKDLPIEDSADIIIGLIPKRETAHDVLVSRNAEALEDLPPGAVVGTSSLRRQGQLLASRPDLVVKSLRGNVQTRLKKLEDGQYDAILLAHAGLVRLGLEANITQILPYEIMLPAPGQGALAAQCRKGDQETLKLLVSLDDPLTRAEVEAERRFLQALGGGCSLPVGALAEHCQGEISMQGVVVSPDGKRVIRVAGSGSDPGALGAALAREALAQGAGEVLHGQLV
jgi:hydroxymethylbilane synthase